MLKKLFHYFKQHLIFKKKTDQYSITIFLRPDLNIDIQFNHPNIDRCEDYNISHIAEKYAQLLIYINSVALKYKLQDHIETQSKGTTSIKQKLFFDNIVFFHDIMLQEIRAKKHTNEPLIKPLSVFNFKS